MATSTESVREFIGHELSLIDEVEAVLTARQDNDLQVWTVVNEFDAGVRAKVYEREKKAIVDEFSELHFGFNILSRRNRPFDEIVKDSSLAVTYRVLRVLRREGSRASLLFQPSVFASSSPPN
ncbi:MAG: hypothetical protein HYR60_22400 [Acidobacteria bacterium]|nr:hypothetical protein [Acidobacteriota bacterium]